MALLCLMSLMLLAQPWIVQSVFRQLDVFCDYVSNETAACLRDDTCTWKVDLSTCHTLNISCIDKDNNKDNNPFCNSPEECGFLGFPDKLLGDIDCEIEQEGSKIKCQVNVACGHEKHICATAKDCQWKTNEHFKDIDNARCVPRHDVSKCIRTHPSLTFPEDLNCTTTKNVSMGGPRIGGLSVDQCNDTETCLKHPAFLTVSCILGLIIVVGLIWCSSKKCKAASNNRSRPAGQGHVEVPLSERGGEQVPMEELAGEPHREHADELTPMRKGCSEGEEAV